MEYKVRKFQNPSGTLQYFANLNAEAQRKYNSPEERVQRAVNIPSKNQEEHNTPGLRTDRNGVVSVDYENQGDYVPTTAYKIGTDLQDIGTRMIHGVQTFGSSLVGDAVKGFSPKTADWLDKNTFGVITYTPEERLQRNRQGNNRWQNRLTDAANAVSMVAAMPVVGKGIKVGGQAAIKRSGIREVILARNMNKSVLGAVKNPQVSSKVVQYKPPFDISRYQKPHRFNTIKREMNFNRRLDGNFKPHDIQLIRVQDRDGLRRTGDVLSLQTKPRKMPVTRAGDRSTMQRNTVHFADQWVTPHSGGDWNSKSTVFSTNFKDLARDRNNILLSAEPSDTYFYNTGDFRLPKSTSVITKDRGVYLDAKKAGYNVKRHNSLLPNFKEEASKSIQRNRRDQRAFLSVQDKDMWPKERAGTVWREDPDKLFDTASKHHMSNFTSSLENASYSKDPEQFARFFEDGMRTIQEAADYSRSLEPLDPRMLKKELLKLKNNPAFKNNPYIDKELMKFFNNLDGELKNLNVKNPAEWSYDIYGGYQNKDKNWLNNIINRGK